MISSAQQTANQKTGAVLIIGGGIKAALDVAESGHYVVEQLVGRGLKWIRPSPPIFKVPLKRGRLFIVSLQKTTSGEPCY